MSDPFVAEIRIFSFYFAPKGWALCDGQLLPISQNTALFSLLGTFYGGDGKSTFALPNLQSCVPVHAGNDAGPGLSPRFIGEIGGSPYVTLLESEIPFHNHSFQANGQSATKSTPSANSIARTSGASPYIAASANLVNLAPELLAPAGGDQPHNNMQPYLTVNFCIAMQGVFPQRP
jgi:microcystin-dependent protein